VPSAIRDSVRASLASAAAILIAVLGGCSTAQPVTYLGHADLQYYKGLATKIDYPTCPDPDNPVAFASQEPRRIRHRQHDQIWDLTLSEATHIALKNNKLIRFREQGSFPRNPLVNNPDQNPSVYDPALQETGFLFGQRGVEAALSDFDAQFSASMTWGHNAQIQNNQGVTAVPLVNGVPTLIEDTATFKSQINKEFADSGSLTFSQEWDYVANNVTGNLFPSVYTGFVRAEYRRPLLAGAGTDYTRIAGPIGRNTPGVAQGVVIARINSDIAVADFEGTVHQLMRDVQTTYWELSLAYHAYHTEKTNMNNVLDTWRLIDAKSNTGLEGSADETQARESFFDAKGRTQEALNSLYTSEEQFRRLLGLPVNDGRVIRPCDEPTVAEFIPDWHISLAEGIIRRPEIRKQKWNIKSLELQVTAAKSLLRPRLDFVAGGQINAFGSALISNQSILNQPDSSAFSSLAEAGQTSWNIGLEASIPIGYRQPHVQLRNTELRLARARAGLQAVELDVSHEIAEAFQGLDRAYAAAQTAFNRRAAAADRVAAYKAQYNLKSTAADPLLRAQQALNQAELSYFQAVSQYNEAITNFYYRTGTILDESNVSLSEDVWAPHAYSDALREAWARSHAVPNPLLHTEPPEFVVPPGRASAASPLVGATGSGVPSPQAQADAPSGQPAGATPKPGNESEPTGPLPKPQNGPTGLPQAQGVYPPELQNVLLAAVRGEDFVSPVTTAAGQMQPLTAPLALPPTTTPWGTPQQALLPAFPVPVAPKVEPVFLAPTQIAPPTLPSASSSWSSPQADTGSASSGTAKASDEISSPAADQFDMPVNQVGQ
jgi:outer membrane protein TolC